MDFLKKKMIRKGNFEEKIPLCFNYSNYSNQLSGLQYMSIINNTVHTVYNNQKYKIE